MKEYISFIDFTNMSEEINKIFEQWKQFLSWCYENNDKTTEIHRDNLERVMAYTRQLENTIKEVRDLFYEKCRIKDSDGRYSFNETDIDEFRNLLDKEVN